LGLVSIVDKMLALLFKRRGKSDMKKLVNVADRSLWTPLHW